MYIYIVIVVLFINKYICSWFFIYFFLVLDLFFLGSSCVGGGTVIGIVGATSVSLVRLLVCGAVFFVGSPPEDTTVGIIGCFDVITCGLCWDGR